MKKYTSLLITVGCMTLLLGCFNANAPQKSLTRPDPNGTCQEKIEYHRNEIKKYKSAVEREEDASRRALSQHRMSQVRQANNRKEQYMRKIQKHEQKILQLERNPECYK